MSKLYFLFWILLGVAVSCREDLINSADREKEGLLVGTWSYESQPPDPPQTIQLSFDSTLTVQISNTAKDSIDNYRYHVEDGILFFLKRTPEGDAVQFFYTIIYISKITLVLEFSDNGTRTRQTYIRL